VFHKSKWHPDLRSDFRQTLQSSTMYIHVGITIITLLAFTMVEASPECLLDAVYTIQLVVKLAEQPVECLFTRCSQLFNWLLNQFHNRLYRTNGVLAVNGHYYVSCKMLNLWSRSQALQFKYRDKMSSYNCSRFHQQEIKMTYWWTISSLQGSSLVPDLHTSCDN